MPMQPSYVQDFKSSLSISIHPLHTGTCQMRSNSSGIEKHTVSEALKEAGKSAFVALISASKEAEE
jgi:hypothetical protein